MKNKIKLSYIPILELTDEELRNLYKNNPWPHFIGRQVLQNKNTPLDILLKHSNTLDVLNNTSLPVAVYEQILKEGHLSVITYGLRVSRTPVWFMEKAFEMYPDNFDVQHDLSRNNSTPESLLEKLVSSTHWEVRSYIASNKNSSLGLLKMLQNDKEPRVLISVKEKLIKMNKASASVTWKEIPSLLIA